MDRLEKHEAIMEIQRIINADSWQVEASGNISRTTLIEVKLVLESFEHLDYKYQNLVAIKVLKLFEQVYAPSTMQRIARLRHSIGTTIRSKLSFNTSATPANSEVIDLASSVQSSQLIPLLYSLKDNNYNIEQNPGSPYMLDACIANIAELTNDQILFLAQNTHITLVCHNELERRLVTAPDQYSVNQLVRFLRQCEQVATRCHEELEKRLAQGSLEIVDLSAILSENKVPDQLQSKAATLASNLSLTSQQFLVLAGRAKAVNRESLLQKVIENPTSTFAEYCEALKLRTNPMTLEDCDVLFSKNVEYYPLVALLDFTLKQSIDRQITCRLIDEFIASDEVMNSQTANQVFSFASYITIQPSNVCKKICSMFPEYQEKIVDLICQSRDKNTDACHKFGLSVDIYKITNTVPDLQRALIEIPKLHPQGRTAALSYCMENGWHILLRQEFSQLLAGLYLVDVNTILTLMTQFSDFDALQHHLKNAAHTGKIEQLRRTLEE